MNMYIKTFIAFVTLTMIFMTSGCATMGKNLVHEKMVRVEMVSSQEATVTYVNVIKKGSAVEVSGKLSRRYIGRGPIPGHIDIEVIDQSGTTLEEISTHYHLHSIKSQHAVFQAKLKKIPPSGSVIRVTHNGESSHGTLE